MELAGVGLYTLTEASRLTKAQAPEIRRWLQGYHYKRRGEVRFSEPLWTPQVEHEGAIGFRDLLELRLVKHFVREGVHLSVIRAAIRNARELFETDYPLTAHRFLTDGKRVFHEALVAAEDEGPLTDIAAKQYVIDSIIRPSLHSGIEYRADRKVARRWFPLPKVRSIVLDPEIAFGKPILTDYGIPVDTIAAAVQAEKSEARVARLFDIPRAAVAAVRKYEQRLAA